MNSGVELYNTAKKCIPGGVQLLTKRPERYAPDVWPSYYDRIQGVDVWDLDNNHYIEMTYNGIGACILGAADPDVDAEVRSVIDKGTMSTLNCPEEVELAQLLCDLHPWADNVRFARSGGEIASIAIRIARAHTGKDRIAFCGYHGWQDWYLAANLSSESALNDHLRPGLEPKGVPQALRDSALPFHYNALDELERIVSEHGNELGVIIMEPIRGTEPETGFLEGVRSIADDIGAVLIFDEISSGFRLHCGGAHMLYGVEPDMAIFAKGMSNGYPMAAVIGRSSVMQVAWECFISSTYWTERIGPVAALATVKKHRDNAVHEHLIAMGTLVQDGWKQKAGSVGLPLSVSGMYPMSHFSVDCGDMKQAAHTYFVQCMLERGFLASTDFYATFAHTQEHVSAYLEAVEEVFGLIQQALADGSLQSKLQGPVAFSNFKRLT